MFFIIYTINVENGVFMKKVHLIFIFCALLLTSCATRVNFYVTRPAELDSNGAKTISVLPIKPYEYYNMKTDSSVLDFVLSTFFTTFNSAPYDETRAIEYIHSNLEKGLLNSPYIDVISPSAVQQAVSKGHINPADVYFTGEVTYFKIDDYVKTEKVLVENSNKDTDKKKEYRFVDYNYRRVYFEFKYQVIDSSNNKILDSDKIRLTKESGKALKSKDLPSAYYMLEDDLHSLVRKLLKDLQPYVVSKSVTLLEDKTKNTDMKYAAQLAKEHNIEESYRLYLKIYDRTNLFEAGYNAALLQQVMGNLSKAESMMEELYEETLDTRAVKALADIRYEIKQARRLSEQTEEKSLYL